MMKRTEIIQYLIDKNNYKSYLEIGIGSGINFRKIKCEFKNGVDPNRKCDYPMTSDKFFSKIGKNKKFDIIFIDGLHIEGQVDKDITNSLDHLSSGGVIVMHDCNPPSLKHQAVPRQQKAWNGTVWKSFVKLRCTRSDLFMCVVDTDWGCGIIKKGKQKVYKAFPLKRCLRYNFFKTHKKDLLNLIPVNVFVKSKRKHSGFYAMLPLMFLLEKKENIVMAELGVFKCESSLQVLNRFDIKKYYAIDMWKSYHGSIEMTKEKAIEENNFMEEIYENSIKELKNFPNVVIIRKSTEEASKDIEDAELDFCFIDADHYYKFVYEDIKNWFPKVKIGGILAGDDYFHPPVEKAVKDFFENTNYEVHTAGEHKGKPRSWWIIK